MASLTAAQKILLQFPYSSALQLVAKKVETLQRDIGHDTRKVIPTAELARKFGVSKRLLFKWITIGLLKAVRSDRGPGEFKRKRGIPRGTVAKFLKEIVTIADNHWCLIDFEGNFDIRSSPRLGSLRVESRAGRPAAAFDKIRAAFRKGITCQGLAPQAFSEAIGVSRSTVLRAIQTGLLSSFRPSPGRILLGNPPRRARKNPKTTKKHLDR